MGHVPGGVINGVSAANEQRIDGVDLVIRFENGSPLVEIHILVGLQKRGVAKLRFLVLELIFGRTDFAARAEVGVRC